jgi:hypothetical protein
MSSACLISSSKACDAGLSRTPLSVVNTLTAEEFPPKCSSIGGAADGGPPGGVYKPTARARLTIPKKGHFFRNVIFLRKTKGGAMSFARIAAIAAAALVLWGGSASAAGPIRGFQAGLWSGGAYTDERTGDFTHCSAGVAYDSGINMFILVTNDHRWWLGFINPRWSFAPNEKMPVELRFDEGPRLAMTAMVPSRLIVLVPLPSDPRLIDRLGRSAELNLVAEGRSFFFQLSGTPAVTAQLKNCVQKSLALQASAPTAPSATTTAAAVNAKQTPANTTSQQAAPPPALTPAGAQSPPPFDVDASPVPQTPPTAAAAPSVAASSASAALDMPKPPATAPAPALPPAPPTTEVLPPATGTNLEEVRLAQAFFTMAQLPNASLVVTDKPAALASFTAVWRSDDAAGAVKIIALGPGVSGVSIASDLIAVDPRMCKGDFASARSRAAVDNAVVFSAVLSCTEANEERTAEYFITARGRGGFVVFAVVGSSAVDANARSDRERIDLLTRAAARAAGNDS